MTVTRIALLASLMFGLLVSSAKAQFVQWVSDTRSVGATMTINPTPFGTQNGVQPSQTSSSDTNTVPFGRYTKSVSHVAFNSTASASQDSQIVLQDGIYHILGVGSATSGYGGGNLSTNVGSSFSRIEFKFNTTAPGAWHLSGGFASPLGFANTYYAAIDDFDLTFGEPLTWTLPAGSHTFKWGLNQNSAATEMQGSTRSYNFDFWVTPLPEPSTLFLLPFAALLRRRHAR